MKTLSSFLITALALFATPSFAQAPGAPTSFEYALPYGFLEPDSVVIPAKLREQIEKVSKSVGRLEIRAKRNLEGIRAGQVVASGTGYIVKPGNQVHTSSHVIELWIDNSDKLELIFRADNKEPVFIDKVLKDDKETDFAVLSLEEKSEDFVDVGEGAMAAPGVRVLHLGYPFGSEKKKAVLGYVAKKTPQAIFLTSPSLPGMSGSPAILIDSENNVTLVVGTLRGIEGTSELAELKGAWAVDYQTYNKINQILNGLNEIGNRTSKVIQQNLQPQDPFYLAGMWNYGLYRQETVLKETEQVFELSIQALEKLRNDIKRSAIQQGALVESLNKTNQNLLKLTERALQLPHVLLNFPLRSQNEIRQMALLKGPGAATKIDAWIAEIKEVKIQLKVRATEDKEKLEFLKSTQRVSDYLVELDNKPELKNAEAHYNKHYIYLPAMIAPLPKK